MKKTNRSLILELLEKNYLNNGDGLTTTEISELLVMQRTNVSRILNELVEEGYAIKNDKKRPVVYVRSSLNFENNEKKLFDEVIGWNGSLKRVVHLAKAAIMYPNKSLYTLIVAPSGSGKSFLAKKMYEYAVNKEVLEPTSPYVKMNCLYYTDNPGKMYSKFKECLNKAEQGFFYVDNCNLLDSESKNILSSLLTDGYLEIDGKRKFEQTIIVCSLFDSVGIDEFSDNLRKKFSITIYLSRLNERPLEERFQLIKKFLYDEAEKSGCSIKISSDVLISLLLYNCKNNVKQLMNDIKQACASAYVRELDSKSPTISLLIMDFPNYVRSGLLDYKNRRNEVDSIISGGSYYVFDYNEYSIHDSKEVTESTIYGWIDEKSSELQERGFSETEINTIVNVGIEKRFEKYNHQLSLDIVNKEQLSQLVDTKLMDLVDEFLKEASHKLNRYYNVSVYFGLCMHMQALVYNRKNSHKISIEQIMEFVEQNKEEYALATDFSNSIQDMYKMSLSIDEIVIIAMFLCERNAKKKDDTYPSILLALHGNRVAKSLAETIKALSDMPIYSYDLSLSKKPLEAYDEIKQLVLSIPHENGILAICDMGSLSDIFNMIEIELGIKLKLIQIPFTTMILDCCRKIMLTNNVEEAHETITNYYKSKYMIEDSSHNMHRKKAIVSFCLTGEGGAVQIKSYLEKNFDLNDIEVIPVRLEKQTDFMVKLNQISKDKKILCIVGTFNPDIYGVPFIPIENVFNMKQHDINALFEKEDLQRQDFVNNSNVIYEHLVSELTNIDGESLKDGLVEFILRIEKEYLPIEMNEKIGLFVHLACAIDKLKSGIESPMNPYKSEIIKKNMVLYRSIEKNISLIEQMMGVKLSDDEIANIICIIKKSKKG